MRLAPYTFSATGPSSVVTLRMNVLNTGFSWLVMFGAELMLVVELLVGQDSMTAPIGKPNMATSLGKNRSMWSWCGYRYKAFGMNLICGAGIQAFL